MRFEKKNTESSSSDPDRDIGIGQHAGLGMEC